jgi:FkbM family methyltransferase
MAGNSHFSLMTGRLWQYWRGWGLINGTRVFAQTSYRRARFGASMVAVTIPGLPHPFWMRLLSSDRHTVEKVFLEREYEHELPEDPALIIDAGANIGTAAVFYAVRFPRAKIIAIEPDPENFAVLQRNCAPYPNIEAVAAGVWHRSAHLRIANPNEAFWARRLEETTAESGIRAVSFSELRAGSGHDKIDLLKIDIEGTEREIFADASCAQWLDCTEQIVLELHDRIVPGCTAALDQALTGRDFVRSEKGENLFLRRRS